MIELQTPFEILDTLTQNIEKQRIKNKLKQTELCMNAEVPLSTYQNFIYEKKINIMNLIKIMYTLRMWDNLEALTKYEEVTSIQEMKRIHKKRSLPKRVKDKK